MTQIAAVLTARTYRNEELGEAGLAPWSGKVQRRFSKLRAP